MEENKVVMIKETFKNEETGELTPGVTIILDGNLREVLEIIMEKEGYSDYPEALKEVIFEGIHHFVKRNK
ncbi:MULTISPECIES: hypothetical protein [Bacillus]|uniref:Uncharacterized protein n=6 Tax=Bacillus cereus group TaxID=86661 RepID=A0A0J1I3A1_BACAN|nr:MULTISPECIES: hypothetical protein [Bacillus]EOP28711.1 hypothetical protein IIS_00184 [Bacillus cereus VD131]MBJ6722590.1 hypothetical protein [Bacillus sp. PR5]MEB4841725.1 hypothetical protein [Paenibacillus jamilae]OTX30634.1 hypothetical protein BK717_26875 [Bacillus thuringiensis serovar malayensis]OUB02877.1 hypothetical protein BK709_22810 [Bacillus thuringiensis serovar shandongiensis]CEY39668.1 Uncharacterised protein [Streptococcus pneumoniae]